MVSSYTYTPLASKSAIRLLKFLPSEDGTVQFSIIEAEQPWPPYFTLSYTWGHPYHDDESVSIGDQKSVDSDVKVYCEGAAITVTENAYHAIQRLARKETSEPIKRGLEYCWIDMICINQSDLEERNRQVAMMGEIYANCGLVVIWLGEPDERSTTAVTSIWELGGAVLKLNDYWDRRGRNALTIDFNDVSFYQSLGIRPITPDRWDSIMHFFTRRWFHRGWVLQEFALPDNAVVLYDSAYLDAEPMFNFARFCSSSGWVNTLKVLFPRRGSKASILGIMQLCTGNTFRIIKELGPESQFARGFLEAMYQASTAELRVYAFLEYVIVSTRLRQVGDARDKVFTALAFTTIYAHKLLPKLDWMVPNYGESVENTFTDVTKLLLRNSPTLSILSLVEERSRRNFLNLPSWVPDFTAPGNGMALTYHQFRATRHWPWRTHDAKFLPMNRLSVTGVICDAITVSASSLQDVINGHKLNEWFELLLNLPQQPPLQQSNVEKLLRTIILNMVDGADGSSIESLRSGFRAFVLRTMCFALADAVNQGTTVDEFWDTHQAFLTLSDTFPDQLPSRRDVMTTFEAVARYEARVPGARLPSFMDTLTDYCRQINEAVCLRRLVRTERGCLAFVPTSTQVGDVVAYLRGARVPFILRGAGEGLWELMGDAYIHGFMDGEIALWGELEFQEVVLI